MPLSNSNLKMTVQENATIWTILKQQYKINWGTAVEQWLRFCATNRKIAGSNPAGVIGNVHWHKFLPVALWPWGRLSLWQKWVPGAFPGCKSGLCIRLTTLPPSCAFVMKSGNVNFLEPSGPLQACNGTALPFYKINYLRHNFFIATFDNFNFAGNSQCQCECPLRPHTHTHCVLPHCVVCVIPSCKAQMCCTQAHHYTVTLRVGMTLGIVSSVR